MRTLKVFVILGILVGAAACNCRSPLAPSDELGPTDSSSNPSAPAVLSLLVTGKVQLDVDEETTLAATAFYPDGTSREVTTEAVWSSDARQICAIGSPGRVKGLGPGGCKVSAFYSNVVGALGLNVVGNGGPVEPADPSSPSSPKEPTPVSLTVQGPSPIEAGQSAQWQAIANWSHGGPTDVTADAVWASANAGTATVSATGMVTGQAAGVTTIQAVFQGVNGAGVVVVTSNGSAPELVGLTISGNTTLPVGGTSQLQATAAFSDGSSQIVTSQASWSSSAPAIASVAGGLVAGQSAGTTTITAAWNGRTAQTPVEIQPGGGSTPQLIGIEVDLDGKLLGGAGLPSRFVAGHSPQSLSALATGLNMMDLLSDSTLELHVFALYSDGSREDVTNSTAVTTDTPLLYADTPGVLNAAGVLAQALVDPEHVVNVQYQGFLAVITITIEAPLLGDLPITALQLPAIGSLSAGTQLPSTTAILNNGVGGTVELIVPAGTAGLDWRVTPRDYVPILGPILGPTVNALLNSLGNLVGNVITVANGHVQNVNVGPLGSILGLLGGVLQVDVSSVVGPIASNPVAANLALP